MIPTAMNIFARLDLTNLTREQREVFAAMQKRVVDLEGNLAASNDKLEQLEDHVADLEHVWMPPCVQEFFERRLACDRVRSCIRPLICGDDTCRGAGMVMRGSGPDQLQGLNARAQLMVFPFRIVSDQSPICCSFNLHTPDRPV